MDLIDRDRLKDYFCEHCSAHFLICKSVDECRKGYCEFIYYTDKLKSVDAVPVENIEKWLLDIAMNNHDSYLSSACEEIISRLDGLKRFSIEHKRGGTSND